MDLDIIELRAQGNAARCVGSCVWNRFSPATAGLFHSLDAGIKTLSLVKNELEKQSGPGPVTLQIIVKFRRHRAQLRQIVPWDRRQIVVLVVIAHVQRHTIDRSVITERLLVEIVSVMLLNPASTHRMQPNRKEKCQRKVKKPRPTAEVNNGCVIRGRAREIHEEPPVPHGDRFQTWRPRHLEKRKKHEPQRLAIPFVADQLRLPMVREVSVIFIIPLMRMMLQMINAKTHGTRCEVRKIGNDSHHFVPAFAPEYEVVSCIVNDHVIGMVSERADAISDEKTEPPITESQFAHSIRDRRLYEHQRHSDQRRVRIAHHQLANFRMRYYDRSRTAWMRLVEFRLIKRGVHRFNISINEPPNRLFSSRQSEARLTRIESALIRPRSETKEAAAKPLPLHNLTDRRNLESLFQPDVPEPAFDGSKRLVVAVLERASHERRIFIGHILHPKRDSRSTQPGAPSPGIILSR